MEKEELEQRERFLTKVKLHYHEEEEIQLSTPISDTNPFKDIPTSSSNDNLRYLLKFNLLVLFVVQGYNLIKITII
jgi:hypothetical protein